MGIALGGDPPLFFAFSPKHNRVICPLSTVLPVHSLLGLLQVPRTNSAAFALSQALGRNSPFTLHVSWSTVNPAEQVSQPPRGALPSDTNSGYSMCKSGLCPGLSCIRARKRVTLTQLPPLGLSGPCCYLHSLPCTRRPDMSRGTLSGSQGRSLSWTLLQELPCQVQHCSNPQPCSAGPVK